MYCNFHWNAGVGEVHFNIPLGSCTIFIVGVEVGVVGGCRVYCNFHWNAGMGEVHFNIPLGSCVIPLGNILLGWMGYMVVFHWVAVLFS